MKYPQVAMVYVQSKSGWVTVEYPQLVASKLVECQNGSFPVRGALD